MPQFHEFVIFVELVFNLGSFLKVVNMVLKKDCFYSAMMIDQKCLLFKDDNLM